MSGWAHGERIVMAQRSSFAEQLKQYRAAAGLTQEQLAERAGLSVRGISDLERGINRRPQSETLAQLINALQVDTAEKAALEAAAGRGSGTREDDTDVTETHRPLIGREVERAAVSRHLHEGKPCVLVFAGEPGIGKTRLLQEAQAQGEEMGFAVLHGGCRRSEGEVPYTPLVEALARKVRTMPAHSLLSAIEICPWLVRLLPELEAVLREPLPLLAPGQERRLVFAAVVEFLAHVSGPAGVLLLLDDLQWAARDALDLLAALADAETRVPMRLLCAYRDTEIGPGDPLAMTLGDLAHAGLVHQIQLGPLHMSAAHDLLDALVPATVESSVRHRILRRAGGLPFFLVSCAQELQSETRSDEERVPWDLAQGIRQRIAVLSPSAQDVLHAAAVVGRIMSRDLLRAVVAMPDDVLAEALDLACHRGLLIERGEDGYGFPHDVIREVIERDIGAARRALLHGRIAEAQEHGLGEPTAVILAYHFRQAGIRDKALSYMEQAGDDAQAQYAHAAAEQSYRDVLEHQTWSMADADRARVQEKLGTVLMSLGRYSDALCTLDEASGIYAASDDVAGIGRVAADAAQVHFLQGSAVEGIVRVEPVVALVQQRNDTKNLARLYVALADLYFACGRHVEELHVAEQASTLATAAGDARTQVRAEVNRGLALISLGRLQEALPVLEQAAPLAQKLGDLASLSRALENIANVYWSRGEFVTHRGLLEQALNIAEQMADPAATVGLTFMLGANALMVCEWQRADVFFDRVDSVIQQLEHSRASMFGLFGKGALCVARGDWQTAETNLQVAMELAEQTGNLQMLSVARHHWAEAALLDGRAPEVVASVHPLLSRSDIGDRELALLHANLARADLQGGDVAAADAVSTLAVRHAAVANDYIARVETWRVQAMVRTAQRRWDEAESLFVQVHTMVQGVMPYDDGRALLEWAIMSLNAGQLDPARSHASEAREIFRVLEARKQYERAVHVLAEIDGLQTTGPRPSIDA